MLFASVTGHVRYTLDCFLTTMAHTLDSVLGIEGLRLARRHHIFRILRSMVRMETET